MHFFYCPAYRFFSGETTSFPNAPDGLTEESVVGRNFWNSTTQANTRRTEEKRGKTRQHKKTVFSVPATTVKKEKCISALLRDTRIAKMALLARSVDFSESTRSLLDVASSLVNQSRSSSWVRLQQMDQYLLPIEPFLKPFLGNVRKFKIDQGL